MPLTLFRSTFLTTLAAIACIPAFGGHVNPRPEQAEKIPQKEQVIVVRKDALRPGGFYFQRDAASPAEFQKLTEDPDVAAVIPNRPLSAPPVPGPHLGWNDINKASKDSIISDTWMAKNVHAAPMAWSLGYTGAGVKVAVVDEGIDFCHPDLQGCQARVTDPSSPYYGWPIVFDPNAMYNYAVRGIISSGYCSTYVTVTGPVGTYRGRKFILPQTSKSGTYHIGTHPSYWLQYLIGDWGAPVCVLVADENIPGVYDTVYVDINKNFDFRDDKPCRKGDELSWWDVDLDGLADYSAGMVYWIADGINPIPASDWLYHLPPPANGTIVCFAGSFGKNDSHGTLVASAIAAKGRIGRDFDEPQKPEDSSGMVYGMAPGAGIIQIGNVYSTYADTFDSILFSALGYDGIPGTGDEADIVNMSWSVPSEDADGWDFLSRYITNINATVAQRTTFVASTGNGGSGFGTVSSPGGASSVVTVGAATLYGSTGAFNPIKSQEQILYGDIQQWSDRGPNSLGQIKPEVAAIGAWATGDVPIYGSGNDSWATWGGTSLSAPIASGALALIYQAYREKHGVFPSYEEAKAILMSGADDLNYSIFEQGAGMVNAYKSVRIASETGGMRIKPACWHVSKSGDEIPSFPHIIKPAEAAIKKFTLKNMGNRETLVSLSGRQLVRTGGTSFTINTANLLEDTQASQSRPDYLIDLTNKIPENTDLMRVRVSFPYNSFSLTDPASRMLVPSSVWMVNLLDWTDLNKDGALWADINTNGAVNDGEMQESEVNPFMFAIPWADVIELSARKPASRFHDGLLLGLHHALKNSEIPSTRIKIELEFYRQVQWDWLSVPSKPIRLAPGQEIDIPVKMQVPNYVKPGIYEGILQAVDDDGGTTTVPISLTTAGTSGMSSDDSIIVSGSDGINGLYDNGRMFTSFDWGWAAESGDWRFYYLDVPKNRPKMTSFILANLRWRDMPADTDLMIYRPDFKDAFSIALPSIFGDYGLELAGSSRRTNTIYGQWPFETATGRASEWVSAEIRPGLNLLQLHNVLGAGKAGSEPFELNAGRIWIEPGNIELTPGQTSSEIRISSALPVPDLSIRSYGFAIPERFENIQIKQENLENPASARWIRDYNITGAGMIDITADSPDNIDIDLYLLYDYNNDGEFDWTYEVAAVSGRRGAEEHIRYFLPKDGSYRVAVHGYKVPAPGVFNASIAIVKGGDIHTSPIQASLHHARPEEIRLSFPPAPEKAIGLLLLGPGEAPGVLPVPITVTGG